MKKTTTKKPASRAKDHPRKTKGSEEHPLEFDRGWQELESQHDRLKSDWSSLAAQFGIGSKGKQNDF